MAKKRLSLDFPLYDTLKKRLEEIGGDVKEAAESALKESQKVIADKAHSAMIPHNKGGDVDKSIAEEGRTEWTGDEVSIPIGFHISGGESGLDGLPSIFLMYGTTVYGQPHVTPDKRLYDAIYGAQTKKEIQKIQEEAFFKTIEKVMKK